MKTIVVTGARGRIACAVNSVMSQMNGNVIRVSRTSGDEYVSYEDAFEGDVFCEASVILHTAWSSVPATSESHPGIEWRNDLPLLTKILNSLKPHATSKPLFVFLSSAGSVYGNAPGRASLEEDKLDPIGWYGRGKAAAESLCRDFAKEFQIPMLILRVSNPYGLSSQPNRPQGLIAAALYAAKYGTALKVWGDGSASKDFLHTEDFGAALVLAINGRMTGTYNVGYGSSHLVRNVLNTVERIIGKRLSLDYISAPSWDVTDSRVNCNAFRSNSGWKPTIDLEAGVRMCIDSQSES
jgi:UDP-glucose 4-epimerase